MSLFMMAHSRYVIVAAHTPIMIITITIWTGIIGLIVYIGGLERGNNGVILQNLCQRMTSHFSEHTAPNKAG